VNGLPGMASALEDDDLRRIGPYRLLGTLGQGGMGRVYLARRADAGPGAGTHPYVAVKVIAPHLANSPDFRQRFAREARNAQRVARFCTAEVIEVDVTGPRPYLVTEFIDGPSLADQLAGRGPLPPAEVERLAIAVATALQAIHAAQLIHRDLKPANIMMSPSGPLVIDFGIARALDAAVTTGWHGTPAFMAPEQANDQPITPAADIHAWGAVLIAAASGRPPFGLTPLPAVLYRILHDAPDLSSLPAALRPVVAHAMDKEPARRPTASELRDLVTGALHSGRASWPTVETRTRVDDRRGELPSTRVRAPRRRWARRGAVVGLVVALAAVTVAALALPLRDRGHQDTSADLLAAHPPQPVGQPLTGHRNAVLSVTLSRDGRTLASGGIDGTVRLWNVADPAHASARLGPLTAGKDAVRTVAASPDGRILASAGIDSTVRLWNISEATAPAQLGQPLPHTDGVRTVAFSPDGSTLATGGRDRTVHLWDIHDPARPEPLGEPLPGNTADVVSLAFSPDGATLASGGWDHSVHLWDVTTRGNPRPLGSSLPGHRDVVWTVGFTPDSRILVTGSADRTVRLWDLTDRNAPKELGAPLTGYRDAVWCSAVSPDGTLLAIGSADGTVRFWDVSRPAGPAALTPPLDTHHGKVESIAFSADGALLVTAGSDAAIRLWQLAPRGSSVSRNVKE